MGKELAINIYTDSWYIFTTAQVNGAIYLERGFLTAEGKTNNNKDKILQLLKVLWLQKMLAIVHCPGHQKGTPVARGNNLANKTTKEVALKETTASVLATVPPKPPDPNLPQCPVYMEKSNGLRVSPWVNA